MEYISAKEAAERWGIQVRGVQELCKAGRIQGAFKFERSWMIPASAKKPEDPRRTAQKDSRTVSYGDYPSLIAYCTRMSPRQSQWYTNWYNQSRGHTPIQR